MDNQRQAGCGEVRLMFIRCVCVWVHTRASASSCPTAYKLSAAIMEEGPHCVKDKSGVCHRWEITVIYEGLSLQRQVNIDCGGLSAIALPFCARPMRLAGIYGIFICIDPNQRHELLSQNLIGVEI